MKRAGLVFMGLGICGLIVSFVVLEIFLSPGSRSLTIISAFCSLMIGFLLHTIALGDGNKIKNGVMAIGTLLSFQKTGTYILFRQPLFKWKVRFMTALGEEVTATAHQVFYLRDNQQFQEEYQEQVKVGAMVPVRYEAAQPQTINLVFKPNPVEFQDALIRQGLTTWEAVRIVENGIRAQGVIVSAQPTGKMVQGHVEVCFQVKVSKPDGHMFEASCTKVVWQQLVPKMQPAHVVEVFFVPGKEQKIAFAFESPLASAPS
ncbi:MAG: hypothetical protein FWG75_10655 [Cystobacterineae bacterium]|nr:hypothetical protein [Cystobacterineae bacterium]